MQFEAVVEIPLGDLMVGPAQARIREVEKDLDELVANIRVHGQLEPIVVARRPAGKYEIVTGQRRYLAHQRLGRETILAAILEGPVDDETAKAMSISENLVRTNLSQKDLIDACTALYRKYGSVKAVSEELGLPSSKVAAYVKYERLSAPLRTVVDGGEVDVATALRIEDAICGALDARDNIDVEALALNLARLSRAQQNRVLKDASIEDLRVISADGIPGDTMRVRQIIVTLSNDMHARLQGWARSRGMTQDEAAAGIIMDVLDTGLEASAPETAALTVVR
jgi:ParB family chromosome partitioning protein